ncbi:MAG: hypothetical protein L0271_20455, partial [Gemmatimonadetes bacterium]|nr:hypothetical protein [Gemmatimonadota bacterium]
MLYEMLTGVKAFAGENRISTLSAVLSKEPPPLHDRVPGVPHEMERIISRCLRKDPARRFQQMDEVRLALIDLREDSQSGQAAAAAAVPPAPRSRRLLVIGALAGVLAGAGAGFAWWKSRAPAPEPRQAAGLRRVTFDSGLTTDPALSPDGKWLGYASDRGGDNLDIWVQHLSAGGNPVRITADSADEAEPSFSPDGGRIVYSSAHGVFVVPVTGGEPRRVAEHGNRPRFSPDGATIAYHVGALGAASSTTLRKIFLVPSGGGEPQPFAADFTGAGYPVWSPDGKHILFEGRKPNEVGWYVAPVAGGPAIKVMLRLARTSGNLPAARFDARPVAVDAWWGNWLIASISTGDSTNLWRLRIDPKTLQPAGEPERITFGTSHEARPSIAGDGSIALSSGASSSDLWLAPVDANHGKVTGEMKALTRDAAIEERPGLSGDGTRLVFISDRGGNQDVWLKDLSSGKETALTSTPNNEYWPSISGDGRKVLYQAMGQPSRVYLMDASGGVPELVTEGAGTAWDISPDGSVILAGGAGRPLELIRMPGGSRSVIFRSAEHLLSPRFSPDGRWIVVHVRNSELTRRIYVVPLKEQVQDPVSDGIPITDGKSLDRDPQWSPDGNLLYWLHDHDGSRCIVARALEPKTKRPLGEMFFVAHFHNARRSMMPFTNTGASAPVIAPGK